MTRQTPRAVLVVLTLALAVGGTATAADARSAKSEARDAVDSVDDALGLSPAERHCLVKALAGDRKLAFEVEGFSAGLNTDRQQAAALGVMARCAPGALTKEMLIEEDFDAKGALPSEVRCMVQGIDDLPDSILIAAARGHVGELDADERSAVASLAFRCMPTLMGKNLLQGMADAGIDVDPPSSNEQRRCVGEGIVSVYPASSIASVAATEGSPEVAVAVAHIVARCSPVFLADLYASQIVDGGATREAASCMATTIVADPALLDALVTASATGSDPPPAVLDVAAACS